MQIWTLNGEETPLRGHEGIVHDIAFTLDEALIASVGEDRYIRIWETGTGNQAKTIPGHESTIKACIFSPDGKLFISGDESGCVRIWDAQSFGQIAELSTNPVTALAISPDNAQLVIGGAKTIEIVGLAKKNRIRNFEASEEDDQVVKHMSFVPKSNILVAGAWDDSFIHSWDTATGKQMHCLCRGDAYFMAAMALSPDGRILAVSYVSMGLVFWDLASRDELAEFRTVKALQALAFSPDGQYLAGVGPDYEVQLWKVSDFKLPLRIDPDVPVTIAPLQGNQVYFCLEAQDLFEKYDFIQIFVDGKFFFATEEIRHLINLPQTLTRIGDKIFVKCDRENEEYYEYPDRLYIQRTTIGYALDFGEDFDPKVAEIPFNEWTKAISRIDYTPPEDTE